MRSVAEIETIYIGDWKSLCAWLALCSPDDEMIGTATKKAASSVKVRGMPGTPHEVLAPLTPDAFCGWMEAA
jgi:hypothetical protein